jgi:hypothetical protein
VAIFEQPKPCGHAWSLICGCRLSPPTYIYNGLCACAGATAPHPFHGAPLPPEYVGRHRKPEE